MNSKDSSRRVDFSSVDEVLPRLRSVSLKSGQGEDLEKVDLKRLPAEYRFGSLRELGLKLMDFGQIRTEG